MSQCTRLTDRRTDGRTDRQNLDSNTVRMLRSRTVTIREPVPCFGFVRRNAEYSVIGNTVTYDCFMCAESCQKRAQFNKVSLLKKLSVFVLPMYIFLHPPENPPRRQYAFGYAVRSSGRCPSVNTYFGWRDISLFSKGLPYKYSTSTGHC